jgi:hypothetical protein
MSIEPGDAFSFTVNSHRHQWNGQICANPIHRQCGSPDTFREGSCDCGVEKCFHLRHFVTDEPRFITPDVVLAQVFAENSDLLDEQICRGETNFVSSIVYCVRRLRKRLAFRRLSGAANTCRRFAEEKNCALTRPRSCGDAGALRYRGPSGGRNVWRSSKESRIPTTECVWHRSTNK